MYFQFLHLKSFVKPKLGPDASLDTHINCLDQLWRLWHYGHILKYGHYGIMAIVDIGAIVHPGHQYGCLKKRLDLRIAASEADFV